jgi:uncharacterized Ntn-hydrolase superfamily protein
MTYSIVARDPETGDLGVAVQSHFFGVGSLVPWARAGVGVIATQSIVHARYGSEGLRMLADGVSPQRALDALLADDPGAALRQVAMLDADGDAAVHTGASCIGHAGSASSPNARAQANLVAGPLVWQSMVEAFEAARGSMAERLLAALDAAESHGGDLRGRQAAAILVVRGTATGDLGTDLVTDLRVDDDDDPLGRLGALVSRSTALSGLIRLLLTPGLLSGEFAAAPDAVEQSLAELRRAQTVLGPGNTEPTVWQGILLARAGRPEEAARAFATARAANPRVRDLVIELARADMWTRSPEELDALLPD